jgi:hypothetical protein
MFHLGLILDSSKILPTYIPITPKEKSCIPPRKVIKRITVTHPTGNITPNIFIEVKTNPRIIEVDASKNPITVLRLNIAFE